MSVFRLVVLFAVFAAVGLTVVVLRVEQTRCAARVLSIESKCFTLRRQMWRVQTGVARLRAPRRVSQHVTAFDTDLIPPTSDDAEFVGTRVALRDW